MPNEPPTLPVSTRTWSRSAFSGTRSRSRMPKAPWQPSRSTKRPSSIFASAERGSIAATTMRLLRGLSFVTCAALAKASATFSGSPKWKSRITLPATVSCTKGAPSAAALLASVTAGSVSTSRNTISAASFACLAVSATTKATGSPT